ncbi:FAD-dependent monooxygenase [Mycolicibacterium sp. CBM1]
MTRSALVVGAGIGGLTAAAAFRRAGIVVTLCERAPQLRAAGFGLAVQSNAMNALRTLDLGIDEALLRAGRRVSTFSFRTAGGAVLRRIEVDALDARLGAPSVVLARRDLHDVLLDAAGPGLRVLTGAEAVGFDQNADGVALRLADGRRLEADILIGADGINSVIRSQLHGAEEPRRADFVCWLALARITPDLMAEGESIHFWSPGMRFGVHDCGRGTIYWWATTRAYTDMPLGKAALLRRLDGWNSDVVDIVSATAESEIITVPAVDRASLTGWGRGRVTLLGDAAHPMLPSLGQGANSAIEDAVVLAHLLAGDTDPERALDAYERRRLPRTTDLVDGSRSLARIEESTNPLVLGARSRLIRHASTRTVMNFMAKPMTWPGLGDDQGASALPRPLSALERWHWTADRVSPLNICVRVRVTGALQRPVLRNALGALVLRHPMLRATISGGSFRPAQPQPIPLRVVEGGRWTSEAERELQQPFATGGPLFRVTLVTAGPDVYDLVLTSTYAVADGVAMVTLARQLLELAGDGTRPADWQPEICAPPPPEMLMPRRFRGVSGKCAALTRMIADAAAQRGGPPLVRIAATTAVPPARRRSRLAHRSVTGTDFHALRQRWQDSGPTPEAVLVTALAMAASVDTGCARARFAVSVSVPFRSHLVREPEPEATGSYQAMVAIPVTCVPGETVWDAAPRSDALLQKAVGGRHHLANLPLLGLLARITPLFTDRVIGALDAAGPGNLCTSLVDAADMPDHIGGLTVSGTQVVSGISVSGYLILSATVGRADLSLNLGYVDGIITEERAEALLDGVVAALSASEVVRQRLLS